MTDLGWVVIGGGTGLVLGLIAGALYGGDVFAASMLGVLMGLLIFAPLRVSR